MLIAGAVCPHPPLLIPAALGSAASDPPAELRKVANATAQAVSGLVGARPDMIVVVGGGAAEREYGADASGGLHAFGIGVTVGPGEPVLPLSLTVGRWLLERAGILARDPAPDPEAGLVGAGAGLPGETATSPPVQPASMPAEAGMSAEAAILGEAGVPGEAGIPGEASKPGEADVPGEVGKLGEESILGEAGISGRADLPGKGGIPGAGGGPSGPMDTPGAEPGSGVAVVFQEVAKNAAAGACLKLGRVLADRARRVALLAMGDACARPAREDPDVPDLAARDYDEAVAEALAAADARWLARLDPALDDELVVAGRAAWQVLAGAARGTRLQGRLLCMSAPYGVTYLVASWEESRTD